MKQSTSSSLWSLFGEDEKEVAEILLNLPNLIFKSESRLRFASGWGVKRRRSAIDSNPPPLPRLRPSSPHLHRETDTERRPKKIKTEASSPSTPLSFSPSESDDKSNHSRKKLSKKRKKEEWLEITERLIQRRELLRGEIETVKSYYNKLKTLNLELKAKKQKLRFNKSSKIGMESQRIIQSTLVENAQIHCVVHHHHHHHHQQHQQQSYGSHTSENFQYPFGHVSPLMSSGSRLGNVNHMGPLGIPDLNVVASVEETFGTDSSQPLDHNRAVTDDRAKAAEARKRRMVRIKEMKSSVAAIKPPR
ncbi:hypothetical protein ACSBR1_000221 [Camellia fascicularis]